MRLCALALIIIVITNTTVFAEGTLENALFLYRKGEYQAAIEYLEDYIDRKPDPYAYYLIGYAHYKMKNHPEAMKYFTDAYIINPAFSPMQPPK